MKSFSESYKAAGVDITAGYRAVELMKEHVAPHHDRRRVIDGIGGFGGLFELDLTGIAAPGAGQRHGRRGHQAQDWPS